MLFNIFQNALQAPLQPVILVTGEEPFSRQRLINKLIDRALDPSLKPLNLNQFNLSEESLGQALQGARDFPCFAPHRILWFKDVEKLKKKDGEVLKKYLEDPVETTILILEATKLDGRLDWVKTLKKKAQIWDLPSATEAEALSWIRKNLNTIKKPIEEGLPQALIQIFGRDLKALEIACEQLSLFAAKEEGLTCAQVERLWRVAQPDIIFKVIEGLFEGKQEKFWPSLDKLLEAGEAPLMILNLVERHLAILMALKQEGSTAWKFFPMPPWARENYQSQARRYQARLKPRLWDYISQADLEMKSSVYRPELCLKRCLSHIALSLES